MFCSVYLIKIPIAMAAYLSMIRHNLLSHIHFKYFSYTLIFEK
jgi:hypothetical protein